MKVLLVSAVFAVAAGVPSNRNGCPSLGQIQAEFESALGLQIPDGFSDCLMGYDNCPFDSFEEFKNWIESSTGYQLPDPNPEIAEMIAGCVAEGVGCPSLDDVLNFLSVEFGLNPSDEDIQMVQECAGEWLYELTSGMASGRKLQRFLPFFQNIINAMTGNQVATGRAFRELPMCGCEWGLAKEFCGEMNARQCCDMPAKQFCEEMDM